MTKTKPRSLFFRLTVPAAASLAAAVLLCTVSCRPSVNPFEHYSTVNLIADSGSLAGTAWTAIPASGTPGQEYILKTPAAVPAGTPSDITSVYLLEIPNLLPNGTFADPAGVTGWVPAGTPAPTVNTATVTATGSHRINGNMMFIDADSSQSRVDLDLAGLRIPPASSQRYIFRFDYRSDDKIVYQVRAADTIDSIEQSWLSGGGNLGAVTGGSYGNLNNNITAAHALSLPFPEVTDPGTFSFGIYHDGTDSLGGLPGFPQDIYIDNFHILRSDVPPAFRLNIFRSDESELPLVDGTYRFSIRVRRDTRVQATDAQEDTITYADRFTLMVEAPAGEGDGRTVNIRQVFSESAEAWSGGWKTLSVDFSVQFYETYPAGTPRLVLSFLPYSLDDYPASLDCTSILIANPKLELLP